ncbi:MAG: hypothetical protein MUE88_03385 [Flavobacteriales bacterium]|jgi:hypothetical protein|nr:hypothetical protein [Flavobacteriales bacterium]
MKRHYRITPPGQQAPTDAELARYRDPKRLVHAYEKAVRRPQRPIYRDPKAFLALLLIVLLAWLLSGQHERRDTPPAEPSGPQQPAP